MGAQLDGMFIWDISDPTQPRLISNMLLPSSNYASFILPKLDNNSVFISCFYGIAVASVQDPLNPVVFGFTLFSTGL